MTALPVVALTVSAVFMYLAGARMFGSAKFGLVTAALFASTPLLWWQSQHAPASLYPLPFVAGWLAAMAHVNGPRATASWVAAGLALGAGVYASLASVVMMPLFLLLTIAVFAHAEVLTRRHAGLLLAGFAVAVLPGAISFLRHPHVFRDTVNAYQLYDANRFNLRQGIREMASWVGLTARSEVYYDYFNPAFLFLTGRLLLLPLLVLIPAGFVRIVSAEPAPIARLSIAGFLAAPFAASLTAQAPTPGRALFLTPFAALLAVYGIRWLLSWRASTTGAARLQRLARWSRP
jgi:hypothetical protein